MITESMMYWITRLDGIHCVTKGILGVSVLITVVSAIILAAVCMETADIEDIKEIWCSKFVKGMRRWLFTALATSLLLLVFVPTTKEMAMIYAVPAITRSDFVREDLPELYNYGIDALKEQMKEWAEPKVSNNGN